MPTDTPTPAIALTEEEFIALARQKYNSLVALDYTNW